MGTNTSIFLLFLLACVKQAYCKIRSTRRDLQSDTTVPCGGVTGFSVYQPDTGNIESLSEYNKVIVLDKYPQSQISIIAHTAENNCPCVKISLGGDSRRERFEPYTLYGDRPPVISTRTPDDGVQLLEAWTYTDRQCTQGESGYKGLELLLVPEAVGTTVFSAAVVVFEGTTEQASEADSASAADAVCQYVKSAFSTGFTYKSNIRLTDFVCNPTIASEDDMSSSPLKITFDITGTFRVSEGFNPYRVLSLPSVLEVDQFLTSIVVHGTTRSPGDDTSLRRYLNDYLPSNNPYSSVTTLSLEE